MKKIILLIVGLLLGISLPVWARTNPYIIGAGGFTYLIQENWNDGDMSDWTQMVSDGTTTLDAVTYYGASGYALKCDVSIQGGYAIRYKSFTSNDDVTMEWYIRISAVPSGSYAYIMYLLNAGTQLFQIVILDANAYLRVRYYDGASWQESDASTHGIAATTWTKINVRVKRHASAGIIQVWKDGNLVIDLSSIDTGDASYNILRLAESSEDISVWHDGNPNINLWVTP